MIDPGLNEKVVMVTGGNNPYGIGTAIAREFATQGAQVFIHGYRQEVDFPSDSHKQEPGLPFFFEQQRKSADEVAASIREDGGKVAHWDGDLRDPQKEISYRASKYALESYSRSAAAEIGPYGITVNVVSPGPVQSGYIAPEGEKALIPDIPLRRIGRPVDIANAVVFFASEQAGWITGQLLFVHGGHRMALGQ